MRFVNSSRRCQTSPVTPPPPTHRIAAAVATDAPSDLLAVAPLIEATLSAWNLAGRRLRGRDLSARAARLSPPLLPPPTPCEHIDEGFGWENFGAHAHGDEWVGHGYWWKARTDFTEPLQNMAGSARLDADVLEGGFTRLSRASVLVADHALLRADFPELAGASDADVDAWLLDRAAYLSAGQAARLAPGGDHHELLGLDTAPGGVAGVLDVDAPRRAGLRAKSGGRAATLFDSYTFDEEGFLVAPMLDVKGVGVHAGSDFAADARRTGLLCLPDALRELTMQRLLQRVADLEPGEPRWGTVKCYGSACVV